MRGESRRCKGSIEPLLKLPDGALATRRIVLVRCGAAAQSCVPCAARGGSCAAHKGVQQALDLQAVQAARRRLAGAGAFSGYRRKPEMRFNAQLVSWRFPIDAAALK